MGAIFSIVLVFAVMLAGIRLKLGLGLSILAGSFLLAILFGLSPLAWLGAIPDALLTEETFVLCAIITVILAFSALYSASGQSKRFMRAMRAQIRSRSLLLAFFPALIGLLPMPGGAIFSAPMVEKAASELAIPPKDQALINYWFRHIWELAWPLYPGLILASSLAGIPVTGIIALLWPGPVVAIALGWILILRPALRNAPRLPSVAVETRDAQDWLGGLPLFTAIAGSIGGEWLCAMFWPGRPMEYGVIAALILASFVSLFMAQSTWRAVLREAGKDNTMTLLVVVGAIFIFKEILDQGHVVDVLAQALGGGGTIYIMAIVLPFLVGFVAGLTIAFVGATFPLLFGLAHSTGQPHLIPVILSLGMYAGYAGIMSSPMHICFLMTCKYFHQDPGKLLPRILVPGLALIPAGALVTVLMTF
jgi:integral membrane protein (TIGR00529 family)